MGVTTIIGTVLAPVMPRTVVVTAVPASAPDFHGTSPAADLAHRLAAQAVAHLIGCAADDISLRSHCRHCGGAHGALSVDHPADSGVTVSLSRAPGLEIAIASRLGPIGIDIESVGRMLRAPVDSVALHPLEIDALAQLDPAARDQARTVQWTRKEALLKATGFGLRIAPDSIALSGLGEATRDAPVQILVAPDQLWSDLAVGGFTPVFTDLGAWRAEHPESAVSPIVPTLSDDIVGTICVLHN